MKKVELDFGTPINEMEEITAPSTEEVVEEETKEEDSNDENNKETEEETQEESESDTEEETSVKDIEENTEESIETEEIAPEENIEAPVEDDKRNDYRIESIVPFSMTVTDNPHNPNTKIASLFYIAKSKSGIIFTLYTSYLLEDEYEVEQVKHNYPFHVENNFSSFRVAQNMIINSYDIFVTDFNFTYNKDIDNYKFSIKALRQDKDGVHETVQFNMISDVFAAIKYIDSYAYDTVINNHELSLASLTALDDIPNAYPTEIVVVEKIDRIVAMAQIKDSTTCGIEYIVKTEDGDKYTLLSVFNLGQRFHKKKFKGMTTDKLNNAYLREADQYLQMFSDFCKFDNIDKEYLIIKARNKDSVTRMFMMDTTIRTELQSMIGEY